MDEESRSAVERAARGAGIRSGRDVSPTTVRRRRQQLYLLVALVVTAVGSALAVITIAPESSSPLLTSPARTAGALAGLVVAFCVYCIEKEVHLRRLERLLVEERAYSAEIAGRLVEIASLLEAGRAVNSALDLREVLDQVLTSALAIFAGAKGSVSLAEGPDELACVSAVGNPRAVGSRTRYGEGITGRVARTRTPVIVQGTASPERFPGVVPRGGSDDSTMCVPLVHRDRLLGVLSVAADGGRVFDDYDLRLLCLFAEHATSGIVHARMHEEDARRLDAALRLEQSKSEFIAGVSHDLRTPLTSIVGCTKMARRPDLPSGQRDELLLIAEAQSNRLASMVERMLLSAELGRPAPCPPVVPLDLSALLGSIASRYADGAASVLVESTGPVIALADEALLSEAIGCLVDNALLHGAAPVRLAAEPRDDGVAVIVTDAGPGIPPADRERVFERFVRLDASRTTPGIGLGLSIARALVGTLGGTLSVEDTPAGSTAQGARFTAVLPVPARAADDQPGDSAIPAQRSAADAPFSAQLLRPGAA